MAALNEAPLAGLPTPESGKPITDADRKRESLAAKELEVSLQMEQADARAHLGEVIQTIEHHTH